MSLRGEGWSTALGLLSPISSYSSSSSAAAAARVWMKGKIEQGRDGGFSEDYFTILFVLIPESKGNKECEKHK